MPTPTSSAGTYILLLDYLDAAGRSVIGEMVCAASDVDLPCNAAAGLAAAASTKRRLVGPFAWEGAFGKPLNFWPVFTFLDHGWYMGVDVGEADWRWWSPEDCPMARGQSSLRAQCRSRL